MALEAIYFKNTVVAVKINLVKNFNIVKKVNFIKLELTVLNLIVFLLVIKLNFYNWFLILKYFNQILRLSY